MSKKDRDFYQRTMDIVINNDVKALKKALELWDSKFKDDEFRIQVLGICVTICEMHNYIECASLILESEYRAAHVVNEETGRTPLASAKMKNSSPQMINLLKQYIIH